MYSEPNLHFDNDFFKDEYRDGFLVDSTMKTVWAAEMELLSDIDAVCQKYNLQWYAYWGTLLGAVRHGGFVPWDDDIDIAMKRADYNIFMEVFPREFPEGYRVYNALSNEGHNMFWGCVMNADTISIEPDRLNKFHNCPFYVGIDVLPIDGIPNNKADADAVHVIMSGIWKAVHIYEREYKTEEEVIELEKILSSLERNLNISIVRNNTIPQQLWRLGNELATYYSKEDCEYLTVHTTDVKCPGFRYSKDVWDGVIGLPFEFLNIPAPPGYDTILKKVYGDYMIYNQGASDHDYPFYNRQLNKLRELVKDMG